MNLKTLIETIKDNKHTINSILNDITNFYIMNKNSIYLFNNIPNLYNIILEGIDTSGKTYLIKHLLKYYNNNENYINNKVKIIFTTTPYSNDIENLYKTSSKLKNILFLYNNNRKKLSYLIKSSSQYHLLSFYLFCLDDILLSKDILSIIDNNNIYIVIQDRSFISSLVYQTLSLSSIKNFYDYFKISNNESNNINILYNILYHRAYLYYKYDYKFPDSCYFIDVSKEKIIERLKNKTNKDKLDINTLNNINKIYKLYNYIIDNWHNIKYIQNIKLFKLNNNKSKESFIKNSINIINTDIQNFIDKSLV